MTDRTPNAMAGLAILCWTYVFLSCVNLSLAFGRVGGIGEMNPPDADTQTIVNNVISQIFSKLSPDYQKHINLNADQPTYTLIGYKSQLVNGVNYFVKVETLPGEYVHVRIYKPFTGLAEVVEVQENKHFHDEINYF